jgi:hypothetical protein
MSKSNAVATSPDVQSTWKRLMCLSPLNKDFESTVSKLYHAIKKTKTVSRPKYEVVEISDDDQDYDHTESFARLLIDHDKYKKQEVRSFCYDDESEEENLRQIDCRQTKRVRREEPVASSSKQASKQAIEISDDEESDDEYSEQEFVDDEAIEVPEGEEESDPESEEYDSEDDEEDEE